VTGGYECELDVATTAVRRAAGVCRAVQRRWLTADVREKVDGSPVTAADFAAQAVVAATLAELLPTASLVAEEDARELRRESNTGVRRVVVEETCRAMGRSLSEAQVLDAIDEGSADAGGDRYWVLDPLDGTSGFLRGGHYAVALALIENGCVMVGVLGCPNVTSEGALVAAVRGRGTTTQPLWRAASPVGVRVSAVADPRAARLCESVSAHHSDHDASARIAAKLGITAEPLRMDSSCKYASIVRGEASIYLRLPTSAEYREAVWDHAAGTICVEEAAGRVTDIEGHELDFTRGRTLSANLGIVATNAFLHDRVLDAVDSVRRSSSPGAAGIGRES
jgi:3'(2'), 5'-bisphosphate nucleotidase